MREAVEGNARDARTDHDTICDVLRSLRLIAAELNRRAERIDHDAAMLGISPRSFSDNGRCPPPIIEARDAVLDAIGAIRAIHRR